MKRTTVSLLILIALIVTGVVMFYFKQNKKQPEPKKLVAKFSFGKQGKELGEFEYPVGLAIYNREYLFVADLSNHRLQVLKINPDGSLLPKFAFGKQGKELGKFYHPFDITVKGDHLYVSDTHNFRIQVLEIKY